MMGRISSLLVPRLIHRSCGGRLRHDRSGMVAVEMAFILPLMIMLYMASVEISNALILDRKVTNAANTVADLVAQATIINNAEIDNIFDATRAILTPFDSTTLSVVVSSVVADNNNNLTVAWSDALNGTARPPGSAVTLPAALTTPGSSVVLAEVRYVYQSPLTYFMPAAFEIEDDFYLRPRRTLRITRVN